MQHNAQRAFTLVELSIVLVILGLLVGGILAGQSLIRSAQLRTVVTEYQRYTTAIASFRNEFQALPGDLKNAASYWGAADGTTGSTAACFYTISTDTKTCNGDGNGTIDYSVSSSSMENYRAWQQLAAAGYIEGFYTGAPTTNPIPDSNTRYSKIGTNIPASKYGSNTGYYLTNIGYTDGSSWAWPGDYGHVFIFGGQEVNDITETTVIPIDDTWSIDTKLDDGKPAFGNVRINRTGACNTTNTVSAASTDAYNLGTSNTCYLVMLTGF